MKVAVFEAEDWEQESFHALSAEHEVRFSKKRLTGKIASDFEEAEIISPFIYSQLDENVLQHFSNLKLIATRSTGFDHIDTDFCKENRIAISNVPAYGDNTVAEHVFGLLLTISHNLVQAIDRTRRGDFSMQGLMGFDLLGKTLGVIGTGNIGLFVLEIAKGFQMDTIAYDVFPKEEAASKFGFRYVGMDELLSESDIISLHVPANKNTYHMISTKEFEKMKNNVVLINTSRGTVVDVLALTQALAEGKIAAAGLDVLPEEPGIREEAELLRSIFREKHDLETILANHILLRMRNVYITPHSAFNSREAVQRILDTTVENIESFAEGEPKNLVLDLNRSRKS